MDIGYTGKISQELQEIIWSICLFQIGSVFTCQSRQRFEDFYFSKNSIAMQGFAQPLWAVWLSVKCFLSCFPLCFVVVIVTLPICLCLYKVSLTKSSTISFAAWTSLAAHPLLGQGRFPAWGTTPHIVTDKGFLIFCSFSSFGIFLPYFPVASCSDHSCVLSLVLETPQQPDRHKKQLPVETNNISHPLWTLTLMTCRCLPWMQGLSWLQNKPP